MDLQIYINSGIIEDYSLGLLGPEALEAVAQCALEYKEVRAAIEACQYALKRFIEDTGLEQEDALAQKEKILQILKTHR